MIGVVNAELDLQSDLTNMENWSKQWQLPFNETKCKVMHFGYGNQHKTYLLNGHTLQTTDNEKDLGVIVDSKLKFHIHTAAACKKANQMLGLVKKAYTSRDASMTCLLYKAIVRPHLEYGNTIWGPFFKEDMLRVERVQRRATKLINGLRDKTYGERLRVLQLPSLTYRRRRGDMIWTYKILNGLVRVDASKFFVPGRLGHIRGHPQRVFKQHATKLPRRNNFSQRVVNDWNSLPSKVVKASSVNEFKNKLDEHWKDHHYVMLD